MTDITNEIQDVLDTVVDELRFKLYDVEIKQPPSAEAVQEFIAGVRNARDLLMDLHEYVELSKQRPECGRRRGLQAYLAQYIKR